MSEDGDRVDPVLDGLDTFKTVVWLDCDPGHDDAMAIILAGWNSTVQLIGISTVASNQTVEKVTRNALDVLEVAGLSHIGMPQQEQLLWALQLPRDVRPDQQSARVQGILGILNPIQHQCRDLLSTAAAWVAVAASKPAAWGVCRAHPHGVCPAGKPAGCMHCSIWSQATRVQHCHGTSITI